MITRTARVKIDPQAISERPEGLARRHKPTHDPSNNQIMP